MNRIGSTGLASPLAFVPFVLWAAASCTHHPQALPISPTTPPRVVAAVIKTEKKEPYKKFPEVIEGSRLRKGFFDSYQKEDSLFLVIPKERFGEEFLLVCTVEQGIAAHSPMTGLFLHTPLVSLERRGKKVFLLEHHKRFVARASVARQEAIRASLGASVLDSADIETIRPDGAVLINFAGWALSDLCQAGQTLRGERSKDSVAARVDKGRSYLDGINSSVGELSVRAKLTFSMEGRAVLGYMPDERYLPLTLQYTLMRLPETPMTPRDADDRIGYNMNTIKDFSSDDPLYYVRQIYRWRLERARPAEGGRYYPKKPITYYLDSSIPPEFLPFVREGVLAWNRAFAAAGWQDAVAVVSLPPGAQPPDAQAQTIRWIIELERGTRGVTSVNVDPRSGEILSSRIVLNELAVASDGRDARAFFNPLAESEMGGSLPLLRESDRWHKQELDSASFEQALVSQSMLLHTVLLAQGMLGPHDPLPLSLIGQRLRHTTMHEVGHSLGLAHNYRASLATPLPKLGDAAWLREHGVTCSVMEYVEINLPSGPIAEDFPFYSPSLGACDLIAIQYGYSEAASQAKEIARQAAQRGYLYAPQHGDLEGAELDPTITPWDLSDDPLGWTQQRTALIKTLWQKLPERMLADDIRYVELTEILGQLLADYMNRLRLVVKYIGGQREYLDHHGDPGGNPPYVPIPKAKQREALAVLHSQVFGEGAFAIPRETMIKLGSSWWNHPPADRTGFSLQDRVTGFQEKILDRLLRPFVLIRLRDAELRFGRESTITAPELFDSLTQGIFSELWNGPAKPTNAQRRIVQRLLIDQLGELILKPAANLPSDAQALARFELVELQKRLDARQKEHPANLDAYTRAHILDAQVRISKILDAHRNE